MTTDPTSKTREKDLPDKQGDLLSLSMSGGKLYVAVEEIRGPRVAVGPYSPAEIRRALDDLELEADIDAGSRALYEAMPEHLRTSPAGVVMPWVLLSGENRAAMRHLAGVVIGAVRRGEEER
ncbi:hypothetical protein DEU31_3035 [Brachybacterium sp. AG952]|uniref:hypothetical protein n=1 Tax=Brachybacterium sp. AG952 TaxID=2183989 RepID=UPI00105B564D|nr:hypothetical protein [Brachybacterium sp. AG952]TDP76328.1 hypothetical protein DEU31_3035 [Brachybacterium sp. AG952]